MYVTTIRYSSGILLHKTKQYQRKKYLFNTLPNILNKIKLKFWTMPLLPETGLCTLSTSTSQTIDIHNGNFIMTQGHADFEIPHQTYMPCSTETKTHRYVLKTRGTHLFQANIVLYDRSLLNRTLNCRNVYFRLIVVLEVRRGLLWHCFRKYKPELWSQTYFTWGIYTWVGFSGFSISNDTFTHG